MEALQIFIELAQVNAEHIGTLNREMGEVVAELAIIKWFIMVNMVAWLGVISSVIIKKIFNGKKNSK